MAEILEKQSEIIFIFIIDIKTDKTYKHRVCHLEMVDWTMFSIW